ncbi:MAG: hypothetical protein A3C30_00150 [Candidatus Levybacteria bacterium RIFCSPHIGHO2_02_FULL_40_18]|nr:MAG: hypothetical protein A2869_03845 [Candidatus Levybacteria bacterium RIFCSPHIGHO2_01_FULL_40_58]OGH27115.1 MAG: hypothetical protein A3C30_00150 [Candidatus Levybacteria bacterium RIFCSPHIGHO2_02_FULL_40_18]OGH30974.1 MAG: hypothetical protein A3E43_04565 [Candidatus Levybacteria bacterium RIFCSPHIGHO2_12_FULL_40_31]OGH40985.1 MAG: hypothetical protein A2894_01780 [Candidatus Levybacteria bacterium RIFCSPLOWO2_01_FULL_40_64]OGH48938.1 MAG: hypothetical protein A3I54_02775 [Candidatus Lev
MNTTKLTLAIILILAAFLRLDRLFDLMMFIPDQGWFYISAKELLIEGKFPLIGITASYTWLHQGALWTYILAPFLWLFNFNPVGGAYLSAFLGVGAVLAAYFVGKALFKSEQIGLITAFLFAVSPLVIIHSRMPYHTAPISLVALLFVYSLYGYAKGEMWYLPASAFLLGILYNLELATMVLFFLAIIIFFIAKKPASKILILSFLSFLIPMIPMVLYDFSSKSGFYQTTAFFRLIKLSVLSTDIFSIKNIYDIVQDLFIFNQRLIFLGNGFIATVITGESLIFLFNTLRNFKKKKIDIAHLILALWILIAIGGIFVSKTASEAYLPMTYPAILLTISIFIVGIAKKLHDLKISIYFIIGLISLVNIYLLLSEDYLMGSNGYGFPLSERLKIVRETLPPGDNYEYLRWWLSIKQK